MRCVTLRKIAAFVYLICLYSSTYAQSDAERINHFSYGISYDRFNEDNGLAFDITTPYLNLSENKNESFCALRLTYSMNDNYIVLPGEVNSSALPYNVIHLGWVARKTIIKQKIFCFLEMGPSVIFPNNQLTVATTRWGGYLLPGVEFVYASRFAFFFEMGGGFNQPCIADKLPDEPYYIHNGSFIEAGGFRLYL